MAKQYSKQSKVKSVVLLALMATLTTQVRQNLVGQGRVLQIDFVNENHDDAPVGLPLDPVFNQEDQPIAN